MSKIVFTSGQYKPYHSAVTHVEDRGYQFGDGIYEVTAVVGGVLVDIEWHLQRKQRSCDEIKLINPYSNKVWEIVFNEVLRLNRISDGLVYSQVTRGESPRNFLFPGESKPNTVVLARSVDHCNVLRKTESGVKVITRPELRWRRPDIKSICLLPSVLKKQEAMEQGAYEVIWIGDDGCVLEGGSSNLFFIDQANKLVTHPSDKRILGGITRRRLLDVAAKNDYLFEEREYGLDELLGAREVFLTSSSTFVAPVVQVDDKLIADGQPGELVSKLRREYLDFVTGFSNY